jgi:uncharacterized coiled-coil DUF342 family protein
MSQFINTEHANESFREAMKGYSSDKKRIEQIKKMINNGETPTTEELLWVCWRAERGILQEESSWYDHG